MPLRFWLCCVFMLITQPLLALGETLSGLYLERMGILSEEPWIRQALEETQRFELLDAGVMAWGRKLKGEDWKIWVAEREIDGFFEFSEENKPNLGMLWTLKVTSPHGEIYLQESQSQYGTTTTPPPDLQKKEALRLLVFRLCNRLPLDFVVASLSPPFVTLSGGENLGLHVGEVLDLEEVALEKRHPAHGGWLSFARIPKGRVEILWIQERMSLARILQSSPQNPLALGDGAQAPMAPSRLAFLSSQPSRKTIEKNFVFNPLNSEQAVPLSPKNELKEKQKQKEELKPNPKPEIANTHNPQKTLEKPSQKENDSSKSPSPWIRENWHWPSLFFVGSHSWNAHDSLNAQGSASWSLARSISALWAQWDGSSFPDFLRGHNTSWTALWARPSGSSSLIRGWWSTLWPLNENWSLGGRLKGEVLRSRGTTYQGHGGLALGFHAQIQHSFHPSQLPWSFSGFPALNSGKVLGDFSIYPIFLGAWWQEIDWWWPQASLGGEINLSWIPTKEGFTFHIHFGQSHLWNLENKAQINEWGLGLGYRFL